MTAGSTDALYGGSGKALEDGFLAGGAAEEEKYDPRQDPENDDFWISRCRSAYQSSSTWFDTNVRPRMEDNMRIFNNEHPRSSRYRDQSYEKRSKIFRPKSRSGLRKVEAAGAAAFFATQDAVNCTAPNPSDKRQRLAADVNGELLNYRLQHNIPWFLTLVGGLQDAGKQGVVISKQEWVYREVEEAYSENLLDEMTGELQGSRTTYQTRVTADHPDIKLRPVENIRFSAAADWRDIINTSPYLIDMEPWFVGDVINRAKEGAKGHFDVQWRDLSMGEIRSARSQSYEPVRQAREGSREDRYEEMSNDVEEHDIVWVHHNYHRIDGEDWYFATLGTEIMLTDPVPTSQTTPLSGRPYVLGMCVVETHKPYPAGPIELGRPLQEEINDVTNLRLDNIRHILSPRYFVKRGESVDMRSLLRNIAGGVTAMENPKEDVVIRQIQDATSSSYQEQDRLSIEYDSLTGSFSQESVASNHNITERVGNTQMLGESANQITEMTIRTFSETWVEKVLQQVMELEQSLESDEVVMAIVGQRTGVHPEAVFRMLELPVKVTVNVGFGATNPQRRIQKVAMAFDTIRGINEEWVRDADKGEVITEILGAVGFKSAERFFPTIGQAEGEEDPMIAQLKDENAQLQQMLAGKGQELEFKGKIEQLKIESKERLEMGKLQMSSERHAQLQHKIEQGKWQKALLDHKIKQEQNAMRKQELVQQRIALNHTIAMDERQFDLTQRQMDMDTAMAEEEQAIPDTGVGDATPDQDHTPEPQGKPAAPPKKKRIASTPKLGTDDKAGVIARGNYGAVPFKEG
jgi:hypothetical protein